MTNEEKARLIADKIVKQSNKVHYMYIDSSVYMVKNAAMEMAQWKDEQAAAAYCKCCDTRECEDYESNTCDWLEKFKKVLRGGHK